MKEASSPGIKIINCRFQLGKGFKKNYGKGWVDLKKSFSIKNKKHSQKMPKIA